jgi:hypothetical protein
MVARAFLILPFLIPVLCGCLRIDDDSNERSIATFRVGAGEVVDIGSLQVIEGEIGKTVFGKPIRGFAAAVTQIPEPWLQSLAENSPYLFKARILRPMSLPAQI